MDNAMPEPETLAKFMHERLALEMGYATRPESRCTWENVPEKNRRLMIATAGKVLDFLRFGLDLSVLNAAVPMPSEPQGKLVLTRAGFAKLARRGLVRCYACESWDKYMEHCHEPKLNADISERAPDGVAQVEDASSSLFFGPDFGCIHFKPRQSEEP